MDKIELIKVAKLAYYNTDTPIMTDAQYDKLVAEVGEESVGAPVLDGLKKIDISDKPMLSLAKCHSAEEIKDFAEGQDLVASIKCDGLSVRIIYEDGVLISANTRGNGYVGQDITEHIKQFLNVPINISIKERIVIDGEAIIFQKDFEEINKNGEFKNPRNLAAGTLASLDTSLCKSRKLSFVAWDLIEGHHSSYYATNLIHISDFGIRVVPFCLSTSNYKEMNDYMIKEAEKQGIPCDGVVWKYNDISYNTERTAHHFKNGIAWKPEIKEYETTLKGIEWSMGRTGCLTPVAIYEPIEIDGSECSRASLHNVSVLENILGMPFKGQKIKIYKANEIIPQISWAEKWTIDKPFLMHPVACPICGGQVTYKNNGGIETAWCENSSCEGKLVNIIEHFCSKKGLDVKGLSKATIEKLVELGWINRRADIFQLHNKQKEWEKLPGFGVKSVSNVLKAIEDSKNTDFASYLSSLGIPLIGRTASKALADRFKSYNTFRKVIRQEYDFSKLDGFGYEMNKAIYNYDYTEADEIAEMLTFKHPEAQKKSSQNEAVSGKVFCITGKSSYGSRDKVKSMIEAAGGKVTGSVTRNTDYLLANVEENTSKYNNAKEYGTKIINDKELWELLND